MRHLPSPLISRRIRRLLVLSSVVVIVAVATSFTPIVGITGHASPTAGSSPIAGSGAPFSTPQAGASSGGTSAPGTAAPFASPHEYPVLPIEAGGTLSVTPGAIAKLSAGHFGAQSGRPQVQHWSLPAPWTGGKATTVDITVRLPANYDPAHARYPTVYVTPQPYETWANRLEPTSTLGRFELAGDIPPMILIFAPAIGGPFPITQCIDSFDGRQSWDTFMSSTLITWVDSHFATIARAAARIIMGSSQGAYCSADLLLRHPDVWNQAVSFDGFYDAPPRNRRTAGGSAVFGGDQALMDAYSPITIAPKLPADVRQNLFFVLAGLSSQDFYGPELDRFVGLLDQDGYARAEIQTPFGHSSRTVEEFLPRALSLIAARLVEQGVLP